MQLLFCSLRPPGGRGEEKNEIAKALFAVKASEKTLPFFQRRNELECAFVLLSSPLFCPHRPQNPLQLLHFAPFCSILALFFFPLCFFPPRSVSSLSFDDVTNPAASGAAGFVTENVGFSRGKSGVKSS